MSTAGIQRLPSALSEPPHALCSRREPSSTLNLVHFRKGNAPLSIVYASEDGHSPRPPPAATSGESCSRQGFCSSQPWGPMSGSARLVLNMEEDGSKPSLNFRGQEGYFATRNKSGESAGPRSMGLELDDALLSCPREKFRSLDAGSAVLSRRASCIILSSLVSTLLLPRAASAEPEALPSFQKLHELSSTVAPVELEMDPVERAIMAALDAEDALHRLCTDLVASSPSSTMSLGKQKSKGGEDEEEKDMLGVGAGVSDLSLSFQLLLSSQTRLRVIRDQLSLNLPVLPAVFGFDPSIVDQVLQSLAYAQNALRGPRNGAWLGGETGRQLSGEGEGGGETGGRGLIERNQLLRNAVLLLRSAEGEVSFLLQEVPRDVVESAQMARGIRPAA